MKPRPPSRTPTCERCSHPQADVEGLVGIRKGGYPTYLCFACVDDLKVLADHFRMEAVSASNSSAAVT